MILWLNSTRRSTFPNINKDVFEHYLENNQFILKYQFNVVQIETILVTRL